MFPARYFAGRYFPRRYWPAVGSDIVLLGCDLAITGGRGNEIAVAGGRENEVAITGARGNEITITGGVCDMAERADIEFARGEKVLLTVACGETVTGRTLAFYLRSTQEAVGSALITKTSGDGIEEDGDDTESVVVTLSASDTLARAKGTYWYDVWFTDATSTSPARIAYGACKVLGQVKAAP